MYIDLTILLILIVLIVMYFKRFQFFVLFIGTTDIVLRILDFIKQNIGLDDVASLINKYLPSSIFDIINKYTGNIKSLNIILKWAFVFIMIIFVSYIIKIFIKKKRI